MMTRSSRRRAHLATLTASNLSPDREKAVKKYRHARKKAVNALSEKSKSAVALALYKVTSTLADEASWDACSALALESAHYSSKRKPAKQARLLS